MSVLKDLCRIEYGKALTGSNRIPGVAKVFGSAGEVGSHNEFLYSQPLIVVGRKGNITGVFKVDGPSWVIDTAYALLPSPQLNRDFLYYFLKYHSSQFSSRDQSTAVPSLAREVLYTLVLNPPSLDIQIKIVKCIEDYLSKINGGVEKIYATINNLNLYKQSILNAAIRGNLVSQDKNGESAGTLLKKIKAEKEALIKAGKLKNEKSIPPIKPEDVPFELPKGWEWVRLGSLIQSIKSGKSFKCEERPPRGGEIGVAKVSAVTWGEYNEAQSKTCMNKDMVNPNYFIQKGDFLFSRANTIELIGATVIVNETNLKVMLSDKILRFNFIEESIKYWVLICLRSKYGRAEIQNLSTGNQESMRNIGQESIKKIAIPMPSKRTQEKIIQKFEVLMSENDEISKRLIGLSKLSNNLKQSILKNAFEGKLI